MQFGVTMFATDQAMRPDELARAAEERGFVSLYVPEHTHIPVSQRTPTPTGDAVLPDYYKRAFDPLSRWGWRRERPSVSDWERASASWPSVTRS